VGFPAAECGAAAAAFGGGSPQWFLMAKTRQKLDSKFRKIGCTGTFYSMMVQISTSIEWYHFEIINFLGLSILTKSLFNFQIYKADIGHHFR
jgi:hypothetical protein